MTDDRAIERVRSALRARGYTGEILVVAASTHTAEEAAAAAGCELGQIIKTLAVWVAGSALLALVAGDRRLDDRLLASRAGVGRKQVKLAGAGEVLELTGYPVGGVSPFGLDHPLPMILDASLRRFATVWVAAGTPNAIAPLALEDLARFTGGDFADIAS
ncbi:MAG TPA: YbaK/EbsC family protein [Dehalococcoidia bacterium]|nr:YbaK/EbsC family protein [Dehalococcoidia bacterium]